LVNRAFEDAFGRASEAVVGLTDGDLFNAATADLRRRNDRQVLRTGQPIQFEETVPVGRMDKTYLSVIFPLCDARQSPYALCGISTDIDQRKQSEERLRSEQSFLKDLIRAHEHDRQLMAYEIHDGLVQYMSAGLMHLECLAAMRHELSSKEQASLELAMHLVRRSIAEGRRVMSGLRPPILDEEGVVLAISYLVAEQMSPSELQVDFHHRVSFDRLDPLLEGTIFRIVQEALTNIKRHSQARRAEVRLTQRDHRIHLQIRDWGIGFDADQVPGDRFGLKGILKRADLVGGQARLVSKPGEGTTILVDLPVTPALS
jgi:signal transduction histidine kinase